jgi:class 3 adenylate cyclase
METAFRRYHSRNSLVIARFGIFLTVLLYALFAVLDVYAAPLSKQALWFIRFAIVVPSLLGVLIFSFHPVFLRILQPMMFIVVLVGASGILAMIDIIESHGELGFQTYYIGLMLIIMAAHTVYRLRFFHALLASCLVMAGYESIAITHQKLLSSGESISLFITNNFFFMSSLILGMAASYFIEVYIRRVFAQRIRLAQEEEKSNRLLLNLLPREIAATLKEREGIIAEHFDDVSILFADLADFTSISARMKPHEVVGLLNEIFSHFDDLAGQYGLEKIKTIGDCYMVAAGVPQGRNDHAQVLVRVGLAMLSYMEERRFGGRRISLRVGINSGPVVAGVIGRKKFIYDLWGDTVNVASRMESHGTSGRLQITDSTHELIRKDFFCEPKGSISVKGKGLMPVWHVVAEKASHSSGVQSADQHSARSCRQGAFSHAGGYRATGRSWTQRRWGIPYGKQTPCKQPAFSG